MVCFSPVKFCVQLMFRALARPSSEQTVHGLGRIQDSVREGGVRSDKCPPTLSNCYCYLTSPFSQEKVWSKYLRSFHLILGSRPNYPWIRLSTAISPLQPLHWITRWRGRYFLPETLCRQTLFCLEESTDATAL